MSVAFVVALAVFFGLLLFLYQQVRKTAWPIALGETPRRPKSKWRVVFATIPVVIAAVIIWAFFIEPNRLIVRHQTIQIGEWPRELSGIRIAVISDIHAGSRFIDDDKLRLIVRRTNELQPSLILILGDYMTGRGRDTHPPERFALILKDLKPKSKQRSPRSRNRSAKSSATKSDRSSSPSVPARATQCRA